jgi:hypothetical protein
VALAIRRSTGVMVSLPDLALGERAVVRDLAGFGRHNVILPER